MLIKVIKFTIKFKIFDFHYPHIPFCNFQNSVSEKIWCCLTFVCVYIIVFTFVLYSLYEYFVLMTMRISNNPLEQDEMTQISKHRNKSPIAWNHHWLLRRIIFQFLNYFVWLRIIDEGEMTQISKHRNKSPIAWNHHWLLRRIIFQFLNYFVWLRIIDEGEMTQISKHRNKSPIAWNHHWLLRRIIFQFLNYFVWLRIIDEGSVSEIRIWSVSLIKFKSFKMMYTS